MELADENDPLAQAIAQAKADLKLPEALKAKASGGPAKSTVPAPAPAPAPAAPSAVSGALSPLQMPSDYHTLEPTRPSSQSPSVTWMALADENDLLSAAIADAQAELGPKAQSAAPLPEPKKPAPKPAAKPAPKPAVAPAPAPAPAPTPMTYQKSQDSPTVSWKSMASDDALAPVLAAYQSAQARTEEDRAVPPGVGGVKKTTQAKLPSVQAMSGKGGLSPEAVLQAMGNRNTIEENMLAQELGVNLAQLAPALSQLENRAAVRVMTLPGGKRSVSKV